MPPLRALGTPLLDTFRSSRTGPAIATVASDPPRRLPLHFMRRRPRDLSSDAIDGLLRIAAIRRGIFMVEARHAAARSHVSRRRYAVRLSIAVFCFRFRGAHAASVEGGKRRRALFLGGGPD